MEGVSLMYNNIEALDTIELYVLFESLLNSYELSIIS